MTVREILKMGDPRLLRIAPPVERFATAELRELVADMFETMRSVNGAGLAAPQIGVGLYLQSTSLGAFTGKVQLYNGATLLGTQTVASNGNGDPVFLGGYDSAFSSTINKAVFSMTACTAGLNPTCDVNDFAVDSLVFMNSVPEPSSVMLMLGGIGMVAMRLRKQSGSGRQK